LHLANSMRMLCASLIVALAAASAGCSKSSEKVTTEARQAAASWAATLSAGAESWGSGNVSTPYFRSIVTQARTSLQKEEKTARTSAGEAAAAPVKAVASHAETIAGAVERGDRAAAIVAAHAAASEVPAEKTPAVAKPQ
jgi:hypothetical protein